MSNTCEVLKAPFEDVFRKFAYMDIQLWEGDDAYAKHWSLCTRVRCGTAADDLVLILMFSPELAATVTDNFLGIDGGSRPGQRIDTVSELTNVLAGQAYEVLRAGTRPDFIRPPELLNIREAMEIWSGASPECRFCLCLEDSIVGGLVVAARNEWSHA